MKTFTLAKLAAYIDAKVHGDPDYLVTGLASIKTATNQQVSFLSNPKYISYLPDCQAGAMLLKPNQVDQFSGNSLVLANPYLGFAKLSHLFDDDRPTPGEVHPSAIIAVDAEVHPSVHLGAGVVIGASCKIAEGVVIEANSVISNNCIIGKNTHIYSRVTLYRRVQIGQDCIIHSGVVLGADGFGFAPTDAGWLKIAQLGNVIIEDKVEIGANSTVDRGALGNTLICRDAKIDNLVHIGHNAKIGEHTALAAFSGVSGSTEIGANCLVGGHSGFAGHIQICDNVQLTGMAMVTGSITKSGAYSSGTGLLPSTAWRKNAVRFRQLEELNKKVRNIQSQIRQLTEPE